jgi:ABC-type branched-subunit amino acid transport system ATPase component
MIRGELVLRRLSKAVMILTVGQNGTLYGVYNLIHRLSLTIRYLIECCMIGRNGAGCF